MSLSAGKAAEKKTLAKHVYEARSPLFVVLSANTIPAATWMASDSLSGEHLVGRRCLTCREKRESTAGT